MKLREYPDQFLDNASELATVNVGRMVSDLLPCPFCGSPAGIRIEEDQFLIVGCTNPDLPESSMLCPNPDIVVYRDDKVSWNFRWWNRRALGLIK
jgi:hypothetical protein